MAFKNCVKPNPAVGGDFNKNTNDTGGSGNSSYSRAYDDSVRYSGSGSINRTKTTSGMKTDNFYMASGLPLSSLPFQIGSQIVISQWVKSNSSQLHRAVLLFNDSNNNPITSTYGDYYTCEDWVLLFATNIIPDGTVTMYGGVNHRLDYGESVWIDQAQLESGSTPTTWEFPGIDLTNQAIPGQELVNNLSLESIMKLTASQSTEWVNNLLLENTLKTNGINSSEFLPDLKLETILQLSETGSAEYVNNLLLQNVLDVTGIPTSEAVNNLILENVLNAFGISSSENVNNLKVINELVLQGIASCETFGELIVYIYYELIKAKMTVKRPNINMYIKHPSVRRLS